MAIDVLASGSTPHARLWVERRADLSRRSGHPPPVIIETEDEDLEAAVSRLQSVAADNVALAQAMRRWAVGRRSRGAAGDTFPV